MQPADSTVKLGASGRWLGRLRRMPPSLLLLAISIAIGLAACEMTLRLTGFPQFSLADPVADPVLGINMPKNYAGRDMLEGYEGQCAEMRTNSLTLLESREIKPERVPGVARIAVVGDSQTACMCDIPKSYPHVLEKLLNQTGAAYEVLNAAVAKYSPYQYYLKAKLYVAPLHPDRLIVGIYAGNDLVDLIREDDRPYLVERPNGSFESRPPRFIVHRDPAARRSWLESLRLYALVRDRLGYEGYYQLTRFRMLLWNALARHESAVATIRYLLQTRQLTKLSVNMMTQSLHQYTWFQSFPDTLPAALHVNREVMRRFRELCRENHMELTYLIVPSKIQIEPEDMREILDRVARYDPSLTAERQIAFSDFFTEEIKKAAGELGVEVIDPRAELRAARKGARFYYRNDMHLNPEGNRAMAEILARRLMGSHGSGFGK